MKSWKITGIVATLVIILSIPAYMLKEKYVPFPPETQVIAMFVGGQKCAECHQKETARIARAQVKKAGVRLIDNVVAISFPGMAAPAKKGDSVQTERDACFVCHK